jgi:pyruvate formate lyase activating enzyme
VEECYSRALWKFGKTYSLDQLVKEIMKDELFFKNSKGGVTFSGGECLFRVDDEIEQLYAAIRGLGVSIGVDTCGHVPWNNIERILPYTDFFLWDIKLLDPERHREYTGADNALILNNLRKLSSGYDSDIFIRYPLIPDINDTDEDIEKVGFFLRSLGNIREIHYLPFHHLGKNRYLYSGRPYLMEGAERQSWEKLRHICDLTARYGIPCRVVG